MRRATARGSSSADEFPRSPRRVRRRRVRRPAAKERFSHPDEHVLRGHELVRRDGALEDHRHSRQDVWSLAEASENPAHERFVVGSLTDGVEMERHRLDVALVPIPREGRFSTVQNGPRETFRVEECVGDPLSIRYAVLGTVLFEPIILGFRRMAHTARARDLERKAKARSLGRRPSRVEKKSEKALQRRRQNRKAG